jgi:hypothetical protein
MAVFFPDIVQHNNPNLSVVDSDYTRGGRRVVPNLAALYALGTKFDQLKQYSTIVYVTSEATDYILIDNNNITNASGWDIYLEHVAPPISNEIIEKLPITGINAVSNLSQVPNNPEKAIVLLNGIYYDAIGDDAAFSIVGTQLTWLSSNVGFDINQTDRLVIRYFVG